MDLLSIVGLPPKQYFHSRLQVEAISKSGQRLWWWVGAPDGHTHGTWDWFYSPASTRANQLGDWVLQLTWINPVTRQPEIYANLEGPWVGSGGPGAPILPWFSGNSGNGAIISCQSAAFKTPSLGFAFDWKG